MTDRAIVVVTTENTYQRDYHTVPMPREEADEFHTDAADAMNNPDMTPTILIPMNNSVDAIVASRCITSAVLLPLPDRPKVPRVLHYGDAEPDRDTHWISAARNYRWVYDDEEMGGWFWTCIAEHPAFASTHVGERSPGGIRWERLANRNFPMTETTQ